MAKTMCPLCGAKTHLNTGDPIGLEQRYPEIMIVGYVCRLCPQCLPEIFEGDRVLIREADIGNGRVQRIANSKSG